MNLVMSQGQATRSTFTFSRVIHFMIQGGFYQVTERRRTLGLRHLQNLAFVLPGTDVQAPEQKDSFGHLSRLECERSPDSDPDPVAARRRSFPRHRMRRSASGADRRTRRLSPRRLES